MTPIGKNVEFGVVEREVTQADGTAVKVPFLRFEIPLKGIKGWRNWIKTKNEYGKTVMVAEVGSNFGGVPIPMTPFTAKVALWVTNTQGQSHSKEAQEVELS